MRRGVVVALLVSVAMACSPTPSTAPSPTGSPGVSSAASPLATQEPTAAPTAASVALPNPGGTCDASRFAPTRAPVADFTFAAMNTRHLVIRMVFRNSGPGCTLVHPGMVALGSSFGALVARQVPNLGIPVCVDNECSTAYPVDYGVEPNALVTITFNSWWWTDSNDPGVPSPRPCSEPLSDVSRTEIPLAVGRLAFSWDTPIETVCSSPASLSLGISVGGEGEGASAAP